jgi:hypothetical protein
MRGKGIEVFWFFFSKKNILSCGGAGEVKRWIASLRSQ